MATVFKYHVTNLPVKPAPGYRSSRPTNQKVNAGSLASEIGKDPVLTIALAGVSVNGDTVLIQFKADLRAPQEAALDQVVAAHLGMPTSAGGVDEEGNFIVRLDAPRDPIDKKPVVVVSPATEGFGTWITGASDDLAAPPGRGAGPPFIVSFKGPGDEVRDFQFTEPIEVHDGQIQWNPAEWGPLDHFSIGLRCPASPAVVNQNNTGNANKVPSGLGFNIFVPAAGDGEWDLDLDDGVPIALKGDTNDDTGYWDVVHNTGVITPSAKPGAARWHMIDAEVSGWLIRRVRMTHSGGWFDIDAYKNEYLHPNWVMRWEIHRESLGEGTITGFLQAFRRHTS